MVEQKRRRDEVLTAAIREATRAELDDHGYAGVTFEGVARRARTSKPVLYRRYRSRAHLVSDALGSALRSSFTTETSGDLRADLRRTLGPLLTQVSAVGSATLRALLGEADQELLSEVAELNGEVARSSIRSALAAAAERGEIGPTPVPDTALLTPVALLRFAIIKGGPIPDSYLDDVLDDVLLPLFTTLAARANPVTPDDAAGPSVP
ncbi:DNA-binding transcriptional regulator, AcrR family [Paraoerskovia marina]|uniref:DNA-binding transcriptional regulator, AcrR family n=1 Tax=Paraoerskovia marina TaxID=545619 RepID=A0A1H1MJF8_9CELL|nr:TetR/AcrR family transcriptional regulator [Paraoerskovia marina]SDR86984.1 DNA-binding transcriptional regulator, AcrR family [Paraoerskovia marina]